MNYYPFLCVLLLLLLLFDNLSLIDIEFVGILQQLVNVISQIPQMLFEHRTNKCKTNKILNLRREFGR